jgi:outer membrane protein OmpA-like peptidoglycan-associated protein
MTGKLLGSLVLGLALAGATPAPAQSAKGNPSSDDIIKALKPEGKPLTRGLHILSAQPNGGETASQAPAISLNVTFELGSAELTPAAKDIVKTLAAAMNSDQLSGYRFQVEGHTDSTGTPDANMDLSQRRANAVREDLISEYNVPGDRLVAVGKGQNEPIDPAHPEAAANRRVQIVNLGASSQ